MLKTSTNELKIRHTQKHEKETVLVLQGGGSLGAYECGVFKALAKHGIQFDIVSGTSIGAINAGIIAGSKSGRPEVDLEDFWMNVAENVTPPFLPDNLRAIMSSFVGAFYGNPNMFSPIWLQPAIYSQQRFDSEKNTAKVIPSFGWVAHLYDLRSLRKTIEKYIDFSKLNNKQSKPRLIVSATDIQRSRPVVYDTASMNSIDSGHLVACAGFPFYGIAWTEKDGKYLWDGALLSNTPLREVIDSSPRRDKKVYIVNLFPRVQNELPKNLLEIWHRARDIMFTEKTDQNIRMSKVISKYLLLLTEMHDILVNVDMGEEMHSRFLKIEREYHKLAEERGSVIHEVTKIERSEENPFLFEDADFSVTTIKKLIKQGSDDAEDAIASKPKQ